MKTIGVITSGGDAPGMNPCLRAVVRTARARGLRVIGFHRAYDGIIEGDCRDLGHRDVAGLIARGGTILRSARCQAWHTPEGRARGAATLRERGVEGLVVIGGDGSFTGAHLLEQEHGIPCVGVPGTIDNDLWGTDSTIGFHTAVNTAVELVDKIRDTAESHERLFLVEVMGRHSGQIAAAVGLAAGAEEILVPEEKTDIAKVREVLTRAREHGKQSCIVIVSEGDDAGGVFDIQKKLAAEGIRDVRVTVLGHVQRGGTPSAFDRILASRLGRGAVEALLAGEHDVMVGIERGEVVRVPLEETYTRPERFNQRFVDLARAIS